MSRETPLRAALSAVTAAFLAVVTTFVLVGGQAASGGERPSAAFTTLDLAPKSALAAAVRVAQSREARPLNLLVEVESAMPITARPGGGRVVGAMPAVSKYYSVPLVAWVLEVSADRKFGRVTVPYGGSRATGWIPLRGLHREYTPITVRADLSRHQGVVERRGKVIMRFPMATGATASPTPPGDYFVTDRVAFSGGGPLGTFAFGISGIQTRLPAGWSGGNQLAIHGTSDTGSIGTSASAGCLRVSERTLERLKPLLRLGTPVVVRP